MGRILPQIKHCLENDIEPSFEGQPLSDLQRTVVDMLKRTPESMPECDRNLGYKFVVAVLSENSDSQEQLEMERARKNSHELEKWGRNVRITAITGTTRELVSVLKEFVVRWVVITTRHSFILSSRMVYQIGTPGLANSGAELWMPCSPKHALVLCRDPKRKIPWRTEIASDLVRVQNEYAAKNSKEIATQNKKLIEAITGKRALRRDLRGLVLTQ